MKNLNSNQDREKMNNIFTNACTSRFMITIWQNTLGKRKIYISRLENISDDILKFSSYYQKNYNFDFDYPIFVFCEKMNFIFKTNGIDSNTTSIQLSLPSEITLLDTMEGERLKHSFKDSMVSSAQTEKISNILRVKKVNEEEKFAHLRQAPRKKTSKEQKVTISFVNRKNASKEYDLFDLSTGGAGLIVKNQELFTRGEFLLLTHIDGRELNPALRGEIMSVRSHDVDEGTYRIGLKFNT